jgi:hypothetical protein
MTKQVITSDAQFDNQIEYQWTSSGTARSKPTLVSKTRQPGSNTIECISFSGYPSTFYGTYFTPDDEGKPINETIRHFKCHLNSTVNTATIEYFEYSETDNGNSVGDIFLLKPSEEQYDQLIECVKWLRARKPNAGYADNAGHATNADNATNATNATNAGHATTADTVNKTKTMGIHATIDLGATLDNVPHGGFNFHGTNNDYFYGGESGWINQGVYGVLPIAHGGTGATDTAPFRSYSLSREYETSTSANRISMSANSDFDFRFEGCVPDGWWSAGWRIYSIADPHFTITSGSNVGAINRVMGGFTLENSYASGHDGDFNYIYGQYIHCNGYRYGPAITSNIYFRCNLLLAKTNHGLFLHSSGKGSSGQKG